MRRVIAIFTKIEVDEVFQVLAVVGCTTTDFLCN